MSASTAARAWTLVRRRDLSRDEVPEQWRDFIKINADYFKNR